MVALLDAAPPAGRSAAGHTWMQRRGIDILAALGMVGPYTPANTALEKIVADKDAPISLRCTASEALAHWVPNTKKIDASTVSQNLGLIAVKACKDELDRIAALEAREEEMKELRELIKKANPAATGQFGAMAGGMGGYGSGGEGMEEMYGGAEGYGGAGEGGDEEMYGEGEDMEAMYGGMEGMGGMGMYGGPGGIGAEIPIDPRIIWSQRRLKYQLTCVKHGLDGMAIAGKASQHTAAVTQVAEAVEAALALTDPPEEKPDLEGLTESIQQAIGGLAFLAPEEAEIGVEPVTELPTGVVPPDAEPALPPAVDPTAAPPEPTVAPPDAAAAPPDAAGGGGAPAEAAAPPEAAPPAEAAAPPELPPGVE